MSGFESVFNPAGFALPAEEIVGLDVQFHWVLHSARSALATIASPGQVGEKGAARMGLILGNLAHPTVSLSRYADCVWKQRSGWPVGGADWPDSRNRFHSGLIAHLTAQALGIAGPACALDAACASALYAIKLACDLLHSGRADLMLAGAVNRTDDLLIQCGFHALGALSRTGRSRPFHRDADGLVPAEGCVLFALRRLEDAIEESEQVLGVIRGVGLSNDGRRGGFLSPSSEGQVRAMRQALLQANLGAGSIGLIECHATGTPVGDAAELRSLREVYGQEADVPLGSHKSNLGHLVTAAGGAGLLKVLSALRHGVRPPTAHADQLRSELAQGPLRVLTRPEVWHTSETPRLAAVSSFGFGGTNAHLLVEQWEDHGGWVPAGSSLGLSKGQQDEPIAIVSLAMQAGGCPDATALAQRLFGDQDKPSSPEGLARDRAGRWPGLLSAERPEATVAPATPDSESSSGRSPGAATAPADNGRPGGDAVRCRDCTDDEPVTPGNSGGRLYVRLAGVSQDEFDWAAGCGNGGRCHAQHPGQPPQCATGPGWAGLHRGRGTAVRHPGPGDGSPVVARRRT